MPNRHGWTALVAGAVAVVIGRLFGLIELYVLGVGLATVVLLAWWWVRRRPPRFEVRRRVRPAVVTVGQTARVELQLINQGDRSSPRIALWEPVGARGGAPMQVGRLGSGESAAAAYRIPTARRGVVQLGPLWVDRRDPFGLATRSVTIGGGLEVLVLPELIGIAGPSATGGGALGEHLRMKAMGQTGSEFHGLRTYQPGDDLRRISWKASARSEDLVVAETEPDSLRRCTAVLDTSGFGDDDAGADAFERAISIVASVVHAAVSARLQTRFRSTDITIDGIDVDTAVLRHLSRVMPSAATTLAEASGSGHDHLGLVVVVAAAPDGAVEQAARHDASPTDTVVVVCTLSAPRPGSFAVDATSLDAFRSGWSKLVDRQVAAR